MKLLSKKTVLGAFVALAALAQSCTEDIDTSSRYVFKDVTLASYLEAHEQYAEYCKLLKSVPAGPLSASSVWQLLTARGQYTVFAPTNEAIDSFLNYQVSKGLIDAPSWDAISVERVKDSLQQVVVYNSIINHGDEEEAEATFTFPTTQDAELGRPNMYDRKLTVHWGVGDSIYINNCLIDERNRNIPAINGYIHCMEQVVAPSNNSLGSWMLTTVNDKIEGYYVASKLALAIGYFDTLSVYRDEVYENLHVAGLIPNQVGIKSGNLDNIYMGYTPEHRYYGYTYFAETDSFWAETIGKPALDITVEDVYNYLDKENVYPEAKRGNDYENPNNLLNRFVSYHFLPERLSPDRLVLHWGIYDSNPDRKKIGAAIWENYTTMGHRRLLKVYESEESNGVYLNRFPVINNSRQGNHHELSCDPDKEGILVEAPNLEGENNLRNGIIYPINKLLLYDDVTRKNMAQSRLRFDANVMWPESMNNNIRSNEMTDIQHRNIGIPNDSYYRYYNDLWLSKDTYFAYWSCRNDNNKRGWTNYLGDECNITGSVEVTMRLPPVPIQTTYEVRYACQNGGAQGNRGIFQFYFGDDLENLAAVDLPVNFMIGGTYISTPSGNVPSGIDWQADTGDEETDDYNDKQMRLKNFMKGAAIYYSNPASREGSGRKSEITNRRILFKKTMDPDKTYYLRFRACLDDPMREMYLDYMELCPKEVYDNPETPEDIW